MNIQKNMELIFVSALAVVGLGSFVLDYLPSAQAQTVAPVARNIATPTTMAVVVIKGHRLRKGL